MAQEKLGSQKELCKIKALVSPERGFEIYLQSNYSFALFASPRDGNFKLGGVECYMPRNGNGGQLNGVNGTFLTEKDRFQHDGYLNLSMLLAKDLAKGVTFNFGVFPISEDKITEYLQNFKQQVKMLFLTYMKPINISVIINTSTVEVENHD